MTEDQAYEALERALADWLIIRAEEPLMPTAWLVIIAGQNEQGDTAYEVGLSEAMAPHTGYGLVHKLGLMVRQLDGDDDQ